MPLIGYARVSTEDQTPLPQSQALKSAGCAEIHEEQASGGNRARPVLARVLERVAKGDTLVVVRIDRLARSLSHLLEVIERLEAKGAFFDRHRLFGLRQVSLFVLGKHRKQKDRHVGSSKYIHRPEAAALAAPFSWAQRTSR